MDRPLSGEGDLERGGDLVDDLLRLTGLADLRSPRDATELLLLLLRTGGERERERLLEARLLPLFLVLLPDLDDPESEEPDDEEPEEELESESDESESLSELESLDDLLLRDPLYID